jgi:hypothetical protein
MDPQATQKMSQTECRPVVIIRSSEISSERKFNHIHVVEEVGLAVLAAERLNQLHICNQERKQGGTYGEMKKKERGEESRRSIGTLEMMSVA